MTRLERAKNSMREAVGEVYNSMREDNVNFAENKELVFKMAKENFNNYIEDGYKEKANNDSNFLGNTKIKKIFEEVFMEYVNNCISRKTENKTVETSKFVYTDEQKAEFRKATFNAIHFEKASVKDVWQTMPFEDFMKIVNKKIKESWEL